MKRLFTFVLANLVLVVSLAGVARAEVKNVQMKIAGYLCGN
jgi:hypothetical protein